MIDYRQLWLIKKGKISPRCFECSRPRKREINSGCFKKGNIISEATRELISKALKGKRKPPRTEEHSKNLGMALKGKNMGENNPMKKIEVREKASAAQRGEKCYNWKGGRIDLKKQIRQCYKYKIWRDGIFERDNFTCQKCENRGGKLDPHHLNSFANILDKYNIKTIDDALNCGELWEINNGMTICTKCHKKTPTYGKNITRESVNQPNSPVFV